MPALFTLPKQVPLSSAGALLPGAKLYFYATGTATPQNTYQDVLLATPHANPVVADSAGVFAPIYFDASLPNYRVKLTTSADVQIYQVDDVPSNQNAAQNFRLVSTAPQLIFEETDAGAGNKKWGIKVNAQVLSIVILNDAESVETSLFDLTRSGTVVGGYTLLPAGLGNVSILPSGAGDVDIHSTAGGASSGLFRYKSVEVATLNSGTFTGTLTGFTTTVQFQCQYHLIGSPDGQATVVLTIPGASGTSNATSMTLTGLPAAIQNNLYGLQQPIIVTNSGTAGAGIASMVAGAPSTITFGLGATTGNFTNSGTKGIPGEYIHLTYKVAT